MSTFGAKTKVVRSEILHILVGLTARGDPYLIVSWTFEILAQGAHISEDPGPRDGAQGWGGIRGAHISEDPRPRGGPYK